MCVIVYKPKKADVTKKTLKQCWNDNPDSGGFMFAYNGKLNIVKGFVSFKKFYKRYRECVNKYRNSNFVIHFRIATHGLVDRANCHPFAVNKNVGFAHNGILNCVNVSLKSNKSDTKLFCENVLKKLPADFLNKQEYQILLEGLAQNECSKFVFLTNEGVCHIFNEVAGTWKNGCWFSSGGYKTTNVKTICRIENEDWYECLYCGNYAPVSELIEDDGGYVCSTCLEEVESKDMLTIY